MGLISWNVCYLSENSALSTIHLKTFSASFLQVISKSSPKNILEDVTMVSILDHLTFKTSSIANSRCDVCGSKLFCTAVYDFLWKQIIAVAFIFN